MGHPKDIFKNHAPLTEQEIKDYLSGNLNEEQRRKVELKMAQDEFNLNAMEGFAEQTAPLAGFAAVKDSFGKTIHQKRKGWKFHHTLIASVLLMVGTMFLGPFLFPDHGNTTLEDPVDNVNESSSLVDEQPLTNDFDELEELSDEEIEASVTLNEFEIVHPKEVIVASPITIDSMVAENPIQKEKAINESILIKTEMAEGHSGNIEIPTKSDIVYSNVPLIYMANFLLVDYSKLLPQPPTIEKIELTGTPSSMENKEDINNDLYNDNVQTITISYLDYLMETQVLFDQHDFKKALKRYKVILNKYPTDLNAHFYSGLCYFNLGKYDLALKHFSMTRKHVYNTFKMDAEWYTAKTFYMQGKNQSARKLLEEIIAEDNYYADQAKDLLAKIK